MWHHLISVTLCYCSCFVERQHFIRSNCLHVCLQSSIYKNHIPMLQLRYPNDAFLAGSAVVLQRTSGFSSFAVGLIVGLAVGFKLTYVAIIPCFAWVVSAKRHKLDIHSLLLYLCGLGVSSIGVLYYLIADSERFLFNNYYYHLLKTDMVWKASNLLDLCLISSNLSLAFALVVATKCYDKCKEPFVRGSNKTIRTLFVLLAFASFTVLCIGRTLHLETLSMVTVWLTLFLATVTSRSRKITAAILAIAMISSLLGIAGTSFFQLSSKSYLAPSGYIGSCIRLGRPAEWGGFKVHEMVRMIHNTIVAQKLTSDGEIRLELIEPVATLAPIYCIEAGLPYYRQLAAGVFLWDIAEQIPDVQLQNIGGVSPKGLAEFLRTKPPSAVLNGFIRPYDDNFAVDYALSRGFRRIEIINGALYLQSNVGDSVQPRGAGK